MFSDFNGEDLIVIIVGGGMFLLIFISMIFTPAHRSTPGSYYRPYVMPTATYSSRPYSRVTDDPAGDSTQAVSTTPPTTTTSTDHLEFTDLSAEGVRHIKFKPVAPPTDAATETLAA